MCPSLSDVREGYCVDLVRTVLRHELKLSSLSVRLMHTEHRRNR